MLTALRAAGLGLLLGVAPLAASAATISPASTMLPDGTAYDIFGGPYFFDVSFTEADEAGSYDFIFQNNTSNATALAVSAGTVLQSTLKFAGGITISWLNSGESMFLPGDDSFAEGESGFFQIGTTIASGMADILRVTYGNPSATTGVYGNPIQNGQANLDIDVYAAVAPIPLPAAGWLLLASIGGLAALKRRRPASV